MMKMNILNDVTSSIYKITLDKQNDYIQNRFSKIQNRYLADNCGLSGEKKDIANHLNKGPAQNLVQTFFKTDSICCNCGFKKELIVINIQDLIY